MEWIDVSFTMKASDLKGGSLMRNTVTGEEKLVSEEDVLDFGQLELDFAGDPDVFVQTRGIGEPLPMETLHINAEDVMSLPMDTLTDKAVEAMPARKPRVNK